MSNKYKYKLFVEGRDDQYVMQSLLRHHGISCVIPDRRTGKPSSSNTISIEQRGGFENLRKTLLRKIKADRELERLGIIVDADDPDDPNINISNRWESLKGALNQFDNVTLPDKASPEGTIGTIQQGELAPIVVGIWLMPNNILPGTLENFIKFLVPSDKTSLWARAESSVDGIPDEERLFRPIDRQKAYLATWLAWQKYPGIPLGAAISQRYLDAGSPHAQKLIDWIRRLFNL